MNQSQASASTRGFDQAGEGRRVESQQLNAYLAARETLRRLKGSSTPCFARDWRPKRD